MRGMLPADVLSRGSGTDMNDSYISVDLETTGLNPKIDKIIEIGAVKVVNGQVEGHFHSLISPRQKLTQRITDLTGINDEMLKEAPGIEACIGGFLDFSGELLLLGHNIIFDYSFLKRAVVNQKLEFDREGVDTLKMCRRFMPENSKKSLDNACAYYDIKRTASHRALEDAADTCRLYQVLWERYGSGHPEAFAQQQLIYKVKSEQPATKKQKEDLRYLSKYHRIELSFEIAYLTRNEVSRITDKIISKYGRIK